MSKHASALKTHLLDLSKHYLSKNILKKIGMKNNENEDENANIPSITIINLIDKNGSQGKLGEKKYHVDHDFLIYVKSSHFISSHLISHHIITVLFMILLY